MASKKIEIPEGGLDRIIDIIHLARELQLEREKLKARNEKLEKLERAVTNVIQWTNVDYFNEMKKAWQELRE